MAVERCYRFVDVEPAGIDVQVEPHFQTGTGEYLANEIENLDEAEEDNR